MTDINVGRVAMIPITSIQVGERARQDLGDLASLESSLKKSGLIQPLAVEEINKDYFLIAGERRYTVLLSNGNVEVPVRIYEDLTELDRKRIEKAENFHRKDMEHWEYDKLVLEIHTLETDSKGASGRGGAAGHGHTLKDTGDQLGISNVSVHNSIKRAEAREAFPDLFDKCKTAKDADKIIKKIDETIVKQTIVEKMERESNKGSTITKLSNCYIEGNFFEGIKKIPDEVIHLVEIDPPYAIALRKQKKSDGESQYNLTSYNEVDIDEFMNGGKRPEWEGMNKVFEECYRVMANHSWLICWFGPEPWFSNIYEAIIKAGFGTSRMCGIWPKPSGQSQQPNIRLANSYEMFFYAWKGQPALNKAGSTNVFNHHPIPPTQKVHPTERPVELMVDIYDTFAFPGSRVLIPFLGSGNGLISAHKLNMTGMGFELSKSYRDSFLIKVNEGVEKI